MKRYVSAAAGAALILAAAFVPLAAPASAQQGPGPLGRDARLAAAPPAGAVDQGAAAVTANVSLQVVLAPADPAALAAEVAALYDPASPTYHRWLTSTQFAAEFGPSPQAVAQATQWLQQRGLHPQRSSTYSIRATAPAATAGRALGTSFHRYRTRNGAEGLVAPGPPLVPANLQSSVLAISGLSTLPAFTSDLRIVKPGGPAAPSARPQASVHTAGTPTACPAASSAAQAIAPYTNEDLAYTMNQVGGDYGIGSLLSAGLSGAGQTVAVYELAAYSPADVSTYMSCFGLSNPTAAVEVGSPAIDTQGGTDEADLDIDQIATQAPKASILVYEGSNDATDAYDLWATIVSQDRAKVISTSWGSCEDDAGALGQLSGSEAYGPLFQEAAAQGQTVLAASGDSGSQACAPDVLAGASSADLSELAVDYPASDPNVTSVGGTDLYAPGEETPWNDCYGQGSSQLSCAGSSGYVGAGGGGVSAYEPRPSWQPVVAGAACTLTSCREVPDVSANAGVPMVFYASDQQGWTAGEGTSFSAPLMAGLVADRNQGCSAPTGNLAPDLYSLYSGATTGYGASLTDVTAAVPPGAVAASDNDLTGLDPGDYTAGSGYDLATGVGSPLAAGLTCPEVLSLSPDHGPAGTTVEIRGLGLEDATFSFGGTAAQVVSETATSATVIAPVGGTVSVTARSISAGSSGSSSGAAGTEAATWNPAACASTAGARLPGAVGIASVDIGGCPGYFVADSAGQVSAFGSATTHGNLAGTRLAAPIIAIEATPDGQGYWMLGADGGVFSFGDAHFYGSTGGMRLNAPVVGMAVTADNKGYWIVAKDGGVFSYGDARFYGSTGDMRLDAPVDGIAVAPGGRGYWLVASDGGVFTFTPDGFYGSMGGKPLAQPIVGMSSTPNGRGYTLVGSDGGVFSFGDAPFYGSLGGTKLPSPIVDLSPTPADNGYYLVSASGLVYAFGPGAKYLGSA